MASCMHPECNRAMHQVCKGPTVPLSQLCAPPPHTNPHRCLHPFNARCALQVLRNEGITPVGKALLERRPDVFVVRSTGALRLLALSE